MECCCRPAGSGSGAGICVPALNPFEALAIRHHQFKHQALGTSLTLVPQLSMGRANGDMLPKCASAFMNSMCMCMLPTPCCELHRCIRSRLKVYKKNMKLK